MACNMVSYHGVASDVFKCMKNELESYGIHVPSGNSGEMSGKGVTAKYSWDGKIRLLTSPLQTSLGTPATEP